MVGYRGGVAHRLRHGIKACFIPSLSTLRQAKDVAYRYCHVNRRCWNESYTPPFKSYRHCQNFPGVVHPTLCWSHCVGSPRTSIDRRPEARFVPLRRQSDRPKRYLVTSRPGCYLLECGLSATRSTSKPFRGSIGRDQCESNGRHYRHTPYIGPQQSRFRAKGPGGRAGTRGYFRGRPTFSIPGGRT